MLASLRLPIHAHATQEPFLTLSRRFHTKIDRVQFHGGRLVVPYISYERFGRRSHLVNKGLINLMPRMAM